MDRIDVSKEDLFTTKHLTKVLDLPMHRLRVWLLNGYVSPSIPSTGQGRKAYYFRSDFYVIALFMKLLAKGFKRKLASKYCERLTGINTPLGFSNFLFIWMKKDSKGESVLHSYLIAGSDNFQLEASTELFTITADKNFEMAKDIEGDWDDIHIINLNDMIRRIDIALDQLG